MPTPDVAPENTVPSRMLDPVTHLPSRSLFLDRLERALLSAPRGGAPVSLMMVDVTRTDEYDQALTPRQNSALFRELAQRLALQLRRADTIGRLSGTTFGVLLVGTVSEEALRSLSQKLLENLRRSWDNIDPGLTLEPAIGIASYPAHGSDATALLRSADTALALAQQSSMGAVIGQPPRTQPSDARSVTPADLREAIRGAELLLHYHPQIDLASRAVLGAEALVRWQRPGAGRLLPESFIPLAEQLSMIGPLTDAILGIALDQAKAWFAQGLHLPVSVNVSARCFEDRGFVQRATDALARRGLPPGLLRLEMTEAAIMTHPERSQSMLHDLMSAGVAVAIDDFGTGHSSLRLLRDLDIAALKIDRRFVTQLQRTGKDASIVQSITALAAGLGVGVVAEGIERRETWDTLLGLGCRTGQGFDIAHPMPAGDFESWLARWNRMAAEATSTAPETFYS